LRFLQIRRLSFGPLRVLTLVPLLLVAATCVHNETLYRDDKGDWRLVGEMRNDHEVSGADILIRGSLFDGSGSLIATADSMTCPTELPAHSTISFGLHFINSADRDPASYDVRVIGGHALDEALPDSGLSLDGFTARRMPGGIIIVGQVANGGARTYVSAPTGCAAFYDANGRVITQLTLENFGVTLPIRAGSSQRVNVPLADGFVAPGAVSVRLWLAANNEPAVTFATTSAYIQ
jgi:hypothetical protein